MRLLAISGSLRRDSYNSALLRAATAVAACACDVEVVVWRGLADIPPYDQDLETPAPAAVVALRNEIAHADALLIATPEYNASVPGALKNALDWASRPYPGNALRNKRVAVVGASQGLFGAVWAQADLRRILKTIGARVDDRDLPVGQAQTAFGADGQLCDPQVAARLRAIVDDLVCRSERRAA